MITSFKLSGTYFLLSLEVAAPKIYPKCVLLVPSSVDPTNGMVILVKLLQLLNAESPILVTLFGIVMLVKLLQPLNASCLILLTGNP